MAFLSSDPPQLSTKQLALTLTSALTSTMSSTMSMFEVIDGKL